MWFKGFLKSIDNCPVYLHLWEESTWYYDATDHMDLIFFSLVIPVGLPIYILFWCVSQYHYIYIYIMIYIYTLIFTKTIYISYIMISFAVCINTTFHRKENWGSEMLSDLTKDPTDISIWTHKSRKHNLKSSVL